MNREIAIAIILIVLTLGLFYVVNTAHSHGVHLDDMQKIYTKCPSVASGWVMGVGFVWATDCTGDGYPDSFWLIYKDGDLGHAVLHIKPLTPNTAKQLLKRDRIKGDK